MLAKPLNAPMIPAPAQIFIARNGFQMLRVDASWFETQVVDLIPIRDRPI
jgi:hypothetical protein